MKRIIIGSVLLVSTLVFSQDKDIIRMQKDIKRYKLENADEKNMAKNIDFEEWYQKDKYEKTTDYNDRINNKSNVLKKIFEDIKENWDNQPFELVSAHYDVDNEKYTIKVKRKDETEYSASFFDMSKKLCCLEYSATKVKPSTAKKLDEEGKDITLYQEKISDFRQWNGIIIPQNIDSYEYIAGTSYKFLSTFTLHPDQQKELKEISFKWVAEKVNKIYGRAFLTEQEISNYFKEKFSNK